jgi:uncharacterized delta-60 repeat protein
MCSLVSAVPSGASFSFAMFSVAVLLVSAEAVRGQSALDGFDPNANGAVRVVVVQPDGKILLGGDFTTLAPNGGATVARHHIARLNPDGTLDTGFDPDATAGVYAIALQPDGKILVGGSFDGPTGIGGQPRNNIARLDPVTGLADSFDPSADGFVLSIAVQADGKVLAGGLFSSIGGQTRNNIARLEATTGSADSFDPNANSYVSAIAVQADGKILAGGDFSGANAIGGQSRNRIARLDPVTGLADSFDPNAQSNILAMAVQADGKILVGGDFSGPNSIGGQMRNFIARLDAVTGLADSFDPNASSLIFSVAVQADGKVLAGGFFSGPNSIGGQTRNRIARLDATTGQADSFDPNANNTVFTIAVQSDGKILAAGDFSGTSSLGGQTRNHLARLEIDGRLDRTLNLGTVGNVVVATAMQQDGKILIGGTFTTILGVTRNNIARLNTDGTLDTAFNPNAGGGVIAIAVQMDGKILVGGFFPSIGGFPRNNLARLDPVTGLVDTFTPNANERIISLAVQPDGKILVAGSFTFIGGQTRNRVARLDAITGLADSFDPNANNPAFSILMQTDGRILVAGSFTSIGGQTRNRIARLDPATGLADAFNPNANEEIETIAVQADGKILAGGDFTSIGGQARNRMARLDASIGLADGFNPNANDRVYAIDVQADGRILVSGNFTGTNSIGGQARNHIAQLDGTTGLADSFNPNANNSVNSMALQADGKVLAGGQFSNIGGQTRSLFARLTKDTAALQNLAATQTTITWIRGGASPQFTRVTFESSTDNVNYTALGSGIPQSGNSNWTLTGLSLSTGQNIYIRARGYYRSGGYNGSESAAASVLNAFIPGPTPTPTPTPTATATATATAAPTPTPSPTPTATSTSTPIATPTATATSTVASPTASPTPTATVTPSATSTPTSSPAPVTQAVNLSTRMRVQTGDNVGIGGFIITGTASKHVLLRAIGPSLAQFGVPNSLANPVLELHGSGAFVTIANDNWRDDPVQEALIIATGIPPANELESAIAATLAPGAYTAIIGGKNNTLGVALVEVYDLNRAADGKLANISTRALVGTGDNVVIGGFLLGGLDGDDRIVVRGLGPSLTAAGVPDALADPVLELRDGNGALLIANNNWQDNPTQAAELIAAGLAPANILESGIAATLPPGLYTALLAGANNGTGVSLVEVYDRGAP